MAEYFYTGTGSIGISGSLDSAPVSVYVYEGSGQVVSSGDIIVTPIIIARFLNMSDYVGEIELEDTFIEQLFSQTVDVYYCEYVANTFVGTVLTENVISVTKDFSYETSNIVPRFTPSTVTIEFKYDDVFFDNTSVKYITRGSSD